MSTIGGQQKNTLNDIFEDSLFYNVILKFLLFLFFSLKLSNSSFLFLLYIINIFLLIPPHSAFDYILWLPV